MEVLGGVLEQEAVAARVAEAVAALVAAWGALALAGAGITAAVWEVLALAAVETWGGMAQTAPVAAGTMAAWAPRVRVAGGTAGRGLPWQTWTETAIGTKTGIET